MRDKLPYQGINVVLEVCQLLPLLLHAPSQTNHLLHQLLIEDNYNKDNDHNGDDYHQLLIVHGTFQILSYETVHSQWHQQV